LGIGENLVAHGDDGAGNRRAGRAVDDRALALHLARRLFSILGVSHWQQERTSRDGGNKQFHWESLFRGSSLSKRSPRSASVTMKRGRLMTFSVRVTGRRSIEKAAT
jgi:hypothetical protein